MATLTRKLKKEKVIRTTREKICHEIVFVIFVIYAFTLIYPFFFLLMNSFKADIIEMREFPLRFPQVFYNGKGELIAFDSYKKALEMEVKGANILGMFFNTVTLSIGQTFVSMALTCMSAYTLAKYRFKGNGLIYTIILICSVVPTFGAEASMFNLMTNILPLRNTYIGMLVMCGGFGASFLYLHSFFKEIPWSYGESAMIDGASDFRIFLQIMLPLAKNGVMVFTIMKFMGFWNDYWTPYLYYEDYPTLAVGLTMLEDLPEVSTSTFFAATILCILPALALYAALSDKLMGNLSAGGIKG